MRNWLGLPFNASASGADVDQMIYLVHYFMILLGVGWGIFFIVVLIRFRSSKNPAASYHGVQSSFSKYLEVAVVVVEAVLLVGFAFPIWARVVQAFPPEKNATLVHVVAEQFTWNIHYPGDDGVFGKRDIRFLSTTNPLGLDPNDSHGKDDIVTLNQMHVPVGKSVIVELTSKDVVHSFKVYEMRVNQDATPGLKVPIWFTPAKVGQYEIVCAQLCGLGHYRMRGYLTVDTPEDYAKWLKTQKEQASESEEW